MGNLHLVQEQLARRDIESGIKLLNKENPWIRTQKKKRDRKFTFVLRESFSLHKTLEQFRRIPARSNSTHGWFLNARSQESKIHPKTKKNPTKCTRSRIGFLSNASKNNTPKELTENPKTHSRPQQQQTAADFFKKQSWKLGKRKTRERRAKVKTTHITRKERKKEREDQEEEDWS